VTVCLGNQLLVAVIFGVLLLIEAKHKEANGRRQIGVLPMIIDCSDQMRQGFAPPTSNFSQPVPEFILKAEARLVASQRTTERFKTVDFERLMTVDFMLVSQRAGNSFPQAQVIWWRP
jgi:hypothetical protein